MTGSNGFAAKAKEVEALAAATENQLLRMTLRILAQDYRALAEQERETLGSGATANTPKSESTDHDAEPVR